ncbi:MAG: winged helix-turn-helix transcriptional regulator [Promethearchaeota archaeon]
MENSNDINGPVHDADEDVSVDDLVYDTAVDIINQTKKPLNINQLFLECINRLGITPNDVNASIYHLLKMKYLVEGSKLTRDDVVKNELRSKIIAHVNHDPGSRVRDIRRALNIDNAESRWHLAILEKFGFLRSKKFGKFLAYYPVSLQQDYDEILCILHQNTTYRVFYEIFVSPNTTQQNIATRLGIHPSTVKYHLDKLIPTGLVVQTSDPASGQQLYHVNTEIWSNIIKIAPAFSG